MSTINKKEAESKIYAVYLVSADRDADITIPLGKYPKISTALVTARCARAEKGKSNWDWIVDKCLPDGKIVQRRSSFGGLEYP